jgi:putative FmdB family regulatory protein
MPIYEYRCESCGHEYEQMTTMARRDAKRGCPECGATKVERKLSVFAARQAESSSAPAPGECGHCGGPGPCSAGGW